ncbi:MAG: transporter substrate-binding domain-containing protein [Lachnospiraceae bacterium]|nr:transporter substrate-binding domain-containing protein [Lachnospiraceae bacterium]
MEILKVCADPFPPYQYLDSNGQVKGKDYDRIMKKLKTAGYEPIFQIDAWNKIYKEFEDGNQDVLFQAQDSPERRKKFYLSQLFRYAITEIVTANKDLCNITSYNELKNYRVGVIKDYSNGLEIDGLPLSCKIELNNTEEILNAVCSGKVDVGVCDQGVKEYLLNKNQNVYPIESLTYKRPLYVMFRNRKHRDDFDAVKENEKER